MIGNTGWGSSTLRAALSGLASSGLSWTSGERAAIGSAEQRLAGLDKPIAQWGARGHAEASGSGPRPDNPRNTLQGQPIARTTWPFETPSPSMGGAPRTQRDFPRTDSFQTVSLDETREIPTTAPAPAAAEVPRIGRPRRRGPQLTPPMQIVPRLLTRLQAATDQERVQGEIRGGQAQDLKLIASPKNYAAYPVGIDEATLARQERMARALAHGLQAIVQKYGAPTQLGRDIRRTLALSPKMRALLLRPDLPRWQLGMFRPDFLHDASGNMRICEINARFPSNGFMITHGCNQLLDSVPEMMNRRTQPLDRTEAMVGDLLDSLPRERVAIIREAEKGGDIHVLGEVLERKGKKVSEVRPWELSTLDVPEGTGTRRVLSRGGETLDQVILELNQEEIEALSDDVKLALLNAPRCINDLRTIFLVHDKRMLAVLTDPAVLSALVEQGSLSQGERETIEEHVVPTRTLGSFPRAEKECLIREQDKYVLKPCRLGKGVGVTLGKNTDPGFWRQMIMNGHSDWVVQPCVEQATIEIVNSVDEEMPDADAKAEKKKMKLVGALLCSNDSFYGPCIYRAAPEDVVNVARGGYVLIPVLNK